MLIIYDFDRKKLSREIYSHRTPTGYENREYLARTGDILSGNVDRRHFQRVTIIQLSKVIMSDILVIFFFSFKHDFVTIPFVFLTTPIHASLCCCCCCWEVFFFNSNGNRNRREVKHYIFDYARRHTVVIFE